jgi:hypothetical protein
VVPDWQKKFTRRTGTSHGQGDQVPKNSGRLSAPCAQRFPLYMFVAQNGLSKTHWPKASKAIWDLARGLSSDGRMTPRPLSLTGPSCMATPLLNILVRSGHPGQRWTRATATVARRSFERASDLNDSVRRRKEPEPTMSLEDVVLREMSVVCAEVVPQTDIIEMKRLCLSQRNAGRERNNVRCRRISSTSARRRYTASTGIAIAAIRPHTTNACHSHCQMSRINLQG